RVEGKLAQGAERRIAGAEVVETQSDLHVAQLAKQRGRRLRTLDEHTLCHLELQSPRIDAAFGQRIRDALHDVRLQQLSRGKVHVKVERTVERRPLAHLPQRLA